MELLLQINNLISIMIHVYDLIRLAAHYMKNFSFGTLLGYFLGDPRYRLSII